MSRFSSALASWREFEGLPSAFASARDAVDALLRDRGLRRTGSDTAALALARGAEASARLELADTKSADAVVQAALRLNAELLALVPVVGRSPAQALARMHALTGLGDPDSLGRPRLDDHVADALQEWGRELLVADAPGLVVASLAHAELLALAPFATANGLVAASILRRAWCRRRDTLPAGPSTPRRSRRTRLVGRRARLSGCRTRLSACSQPSMPALSRTA
jgi:hypothetical protein